MDTPHTSSRNQGKILKFHGIERVKGYQSRELSLVLSTLLTDCKVNDLSQNCAWRKIIKITVCNSSGFKNVLVL